MGYFPVFFDISSKDILVVGAGEVATRRVLTLIEFCGNIHVISPSITPILRELFEANKISYSQKKFCKEDIISPFLVLATTDDKDLNQEIVNICKQKNILVNNACDRKSCDFYFPAIAVIGLILSQKKEY
ncbi:MAG: bifunctional precorrin-2 dehydrogenase/sirohydrochlorin ferrochelatase [bacterium]|nr:bifunctional precorrin-2 dehydrogenase/sirohydrochlorin ferrochelatase [bacterium]